MHRTAKGVSYIHGSSSGQFVIETYIVIVLSKYSFLMKQVYQNSARNIYNFENVILN